HVRLLERYSRLESCVRQILACDLQHLTVQITAVDTAVLRRALPPARLLEHGRPLVTIEHVELLAAKASSRTGRAVKGDLGSLEQEGTRTAHRVQQRKGWSPLGKAQNSRGEVLAQGRLHPLCAQS